MGTIEVVLIGLILIIMTGSAGVYVNHVKAKKPAVEKLHNCGKKLEEKDCEQTVFECTKEGSFTLDEGLAHIQVNADKGTTSHVKIENEGLNTWITVNSSNEDHSLDYMTTLPDR